MAGVELMPWFMPATRSSHPCGPSVHSGTPAVSRARIEQHEGDDAGDGAPLPVGQALRERDERAGTGERR